MFGKKNKNTECSHKFEPRYDERANPNVLRMEGTVNVDEMRKLVYYKVYVHDICVRCGKVIKRSN